MNRMMVELSAALCRSTDSIFRQYEKTNNVVYSKTKKDRHIYVDNGSKVLAVAHVDTVLDSFFSLKPTENLFHHKVKKGKNKITSIQLDDRLGFWVITDYLPNHLGLTFDLLLTENEEIGLSTASDFVTDKEYNWIFEFDRRGADCLVMYQYDDKALRDIMQVYGFRTEMGSFSDISYLDHLGCKAFNFGVGYHNEHSVNCNVVLEDTLRSCKKFAKFFLDNQDKKFHHTYTPAYVSSYKYSNNYSRLDDWELTNHRNLWGTMGDSTRSDNRKLDCLVCNQLFNYSDLINGMYCHDCADWLEHDHGFNVRAEKLPHVECADCGADITYEQQHSLVSLFPQDKLCDECYPYWVKYSEHFSEDHIDEDVDWKVTKDSEEDVD